MTGINMQLLALASEAVARMEKSAVVGPGGGAPPMDPAMGGMPPGAPPMDPAMMGMPPGAPPMDPAMVGMPPMDPAMMGMAPPPPAPAPAAPAPADPASAPNAAGAKVKPDQWMQTINYQMYNMQQQMAAIMNALGVQLPPESAVIPPGPGGPTLPDATAPEGGGEAATPAPAPAEPAKTASVYENRPALLRACDAVDTANAIESILYARARQVSR